MITIQNADAALKDYYLEAFGAQLDGEASPFFSAVEKTAANVVGKDVKISVIKGTLGSIAAGDEDGDLPTPYTNRYYQITLPLKNIYGTVEISDKALRAARESSGAFVNLLDAEMEGLVKSARANFSRMLFGNGNGYLMDLMGKEDAHTLNVTGLKSYMLGMIIDIYSGTTPVATGLTILGVDPEYNTISVDKDVTSMTLASGNKIFVSGAYGKELLGLDALFTGDFLYGYDKEENYYFKPKVKAFMTDSFTESDLLDFIDEIETNSDGKTNMILCSHRSRKIIASLLSDSRRIINSSDINAGFGEITVNGIPVYADKFCPDGNIYLLNTNDFSLCQLCDWEWLEDEDGKILKQVPGKAAYSATLVKYAELVCKKPCGQGLIRLMQ